MQDCPALEDLKTQFLRPTGDPQVARQRILVSFPFPPYHPLFSAVLLSFKYAGLTLITAYKVLWSFAPIAFGAAFAWLLASLWGMLPTGAALFLLAFKVYPSNGLHYLTPSSLAMGIAAIMWTRLIQRRGNAPWTLVIGSLLLMSTHPIGGRICIAPPLARHFLVGTGKQTKSLDFVVRGTWNCRPRHFPRYRHKPPQPGECVGCNQRDSWCCGHHPGVHLESSRGAGIIGHSQSGFVRPPDYLFPAVVVGILLMPSGQGTLLMRFTMLYAVIFFSAMHHTHVISP